MTQELLMIIWTTAACANYNPKSDVIGVHGKCMARAEKIFKFACPVNTRTEKCGENLKRELALGQSVLGK